MTQADTPAPAVPLDGRFCSVCGIAHSWKRHDGSAADEIRAALQDAAAMAAARADRQDRYSPDNWHALMLHCEAADKRLSGLLADAALLDRIEAELHRFADSDTAELGIARLGQRDHVFCVSMPGSTSGYEYADTLRDALREALSRALPEGGL